MVPTLGQNLRTYLPTINVSIVVRAGGVLPGKLPEILLPHNFSNFLVSNFVRGMCSCPKPLQTDGPKTVSAF
jgi:hypothetical protein